MPMDIHRLAISCPFSVWKLTDMGHEAVKILFFYLTHLELVVLNEVLRGFHCGPLISTTYRALC